MGIDLSKKTSRRGFLIKTFTSLGVMAVLPTVAKDLLSEAFAFSSAPLSGAPLCYEPLDREGGEPQILIMPKGYLVLIEPTRARSQGSGVQDRSGEARVFLQNFGGANIIRFKALDNASRVDIPDGTFRNGQRYSGQDENLQRLAADIKNGLHTGNYELYKPYADRLGPNEGVAIVYASPLWTRLNIKGNRVQVTNRFFAPELPPNGMGFKFDMPLEYGDIDVTRTTTSLVNALPKEFNTLSAENRRVLGLHLLALSAQNTALLLKTYHTTLPEHKAFEKGTLGFSADGQGMDRGVFQNALQQRPDVLVGFIQRLLAPLPKISPDKPYAVKQRPASTQSATKTPKTYSPYPQN